MIPVMPDQVTQFLRREQERIDREFQQFLEPEDASNPGDLLERMPALRRSIRTGLEWLTDRLSAGEILALQTQLNEYLDELLGERLRRAFDELTWRAQRDPLTGLRHRAAFDPRLSEEIERARRYGREVSLILFDLDHFKSINDRFGHPMGDKLLIEAAQLMKRSLRLNDEAFRLGGDEFGALCPETGREAGMAAARRLEETLQRHLLAAGLDGQGGISWGVAAFPLDAADAGALIEVADRRLYQCKQTHHRAIGVSS